jgi:hypothetical protein
MRSHAKSCKVTRFHAESCGVTQSYAKSRTDSRYEGVSSCPIAWVCQSVWLCSTMSITSIGVLVLSQNDHGSGHNDQVLLYIYQGTWVEEDVGLGLYFMGPNN